MSQQPEHQSNTASEAIGIFLELAAAKGWFLTEGANDGSTWTVDYDDIERLKTEVQVSTTKPSRSSRISRPTALAEPHHQTRKNA